MPVIGLITDFNDDFAIGRVKASMTRIAPATNIIGISHNVPRGGVREAAIILLNILQYSAEDTVFCVMVGAEVNRLEHNPVVVATRRNIYIAPDNGVLTHVLANQNIIAAAKIMQFSMFDARIKSFSVATPEKRTGNLNRGFDLFGPAAAWFAAGGNIHHMAHNGSEYIDSERLVRIDTPRLAIEGDTISGEVMFAKGIRFTTSVGRIEQVANNRLKLSSDLHKNLPQIELDYNATVTVGDLTLTGLRNHYDALEPGKPHAVIGLSGYLELVLPDDIRLKEGDRVTLTASTDAEHTGDS